jgi:hypothetical protein
MNANLHTLARQTNQKEFTFITRKHHCRSCGAVVCDDCSQHREYLSRPAREGASSPQSQDAGNDVGGTVAATPSLERVCDACKADFMALERSTSLSRVATAF